MASHPAGTDIRKLSSFSVFRLRANAAGVLFWRATRLSHADIGFHVKWFQVVLALLLCHTQVYADCDLS
jgi:hypothetical protein